MAKRVGGLSWPVVMEQVLRTLMRTTDIVVAAFFSPASIAAVGLADLYSRFALNVGMGLGGGAIALSSQDTGSGSLASRNQVVSQALFIGFLAGFPFVFFGLFFAGAAFEILGAEAELVQTGRAYLAIILMTSPARHVALIAARSLQGTGDTRTPMVANVASNGLNIVGTVILAFGLGPIPALGVVGIGLATAAGDLFTAVALLFVILHPRTAIQLSIPRNLTVAVQLIRVSSHYIAQGIMETAADFPLNAILLQFGTSVNAAYQIGRRLNMQFIAPVSRGFEVGANILVGQALGRKNGSLAYSTGWLTVIIGAGMASLLALFLWLLSAPFVSLFAQDAETADLAVSFIWAYCLAAPFTAASMILAGALRGGSETRSSLVARTVGKLGFLVGIAYFFGLYLKMGVRVVYPAIVLEYLSGACILAWAFQRRKWMKRALAMMAERNSFGSAQVQAEPAGDA